MHRSEKASLDYKPTVQKRVGKSNCNQPKTPKLIKPTYISAKIESYDEIIDLARQGIANIAELSQQFEDLLTSGKFQNELHITLGHVMSSREKEGKRMWKSFCKRYTDQITKYNDRLIENTAGTSINQGKSVETTDKLKFRLKKLCWDQKIIAIVVELSGGEGGCIIDSNGDNVKELYCQNKVPHITLCKLAW